MTTEIRRVAKKWAFVRSNRGDQAGCWIDLQPSDVDDEDVLDSTLPAAVLVLTTAVVANDPPEGSADRELRGHVPAIVMLRVFGLPAESTAKLDARQKRLPVPVSLLLAPDHGPAGFVADGAAVAKALRDGKVGLPDATLRAMQTVTMRMTLRDVGVDPKIAVPSPGAMAVSGADSCPMDQ